MMRVLTYFVGVSAAISIGLVSFMALQSPNSIVTPSAAAVLLHIRMPFALRLLSATAALHKERLAEPGEQQRLVGQKNARLNQKNKMVPSSVSASLRAP
jgi:hypothetical protein